MTTDESGETVSHSESDDRLEIVEEHVRQENQHDLDGIMETFGAEPCYDDEPWDDHHAGRAGVRTYYEDLLTALPDLHIDIQVRHVTDDQVILEVVISGTHTGPWRGLPGTGHHVEFPLCAVYAFDEQDKLARERIYYDRATVLRQLGIFREPDRGIGRLFTPLIHPLTIVRILLLKLRRR